MLPDDLEILLATRLGFDPQSVGVAAVSSAVRQAMTTAGFTDLAAYVRWVALDEAAWDALVDQVVVPETSFFRDGSPFDFVVARARAISAEHRTRVLRILSCPCSSGEEPYSLVMALLDAGISPETFVVHAVDVSQRAIERARTGLFREHSFRGAELAYRERYFDRADASLWRISEVVRGSAITEQGNMLAPDFLAGMPPFDVVFCRNLLIYLHADARLAVLSAVRRLLMPDGVLVVGHAEAAIARAHGFAALKQAGTFAFAHAPLAPVRAEERIRSPRTQASPALVEKPAEPPPAAHRAPAATRTAALHDVRDRAATSPETTAEPSPLARARRYADEGHLAAAMGACSDYLHQVPDSADGHFLMGVLHAAEGRRQQAVASFTRALHLDPAHAGALGHLALKHEAIGDSTGAARLRARERRALDLSGGES